MHIGLLSFNPIVGDLEGNLQKLLLWGEKAKEKKLDVLVLPELALQGYPVGDFLLRPSFATALEAQLKKLQSSWKEKGLEEISLIVGSVFPNPNKVGLPWINGVLCLEEGELHFRGKTLLPNYDIFNEQRYFGSALSLEPIYRSPLSIKGHRVGVLVCEDSWHTTKVLGKPIYSLDPSQELKKQGCDFFINISASPFEYSKKKERTEIICNKAKRNEIDCFYLNLSGANDEIIFDGHAFFVDKEGKLIEESDRFQESLFCFDYEKGKSLQLQKKEAVYSVEEELYQALVLGIRDYVKKNAFTKALIGLSGGIDSALTACLAVDALGKENVLTIFLPTVYSSPESKRDAEEVAKNLGLCLEELSIESLRKDIDKLLGGMFQGKSEDFTEENIQSRLRGNLLMAVSNKLGHLLLATGNKSEIATGYCTLYGDMCGGLTPLGDLYKYQVVALARHRNKKGACIPVSVLEKEPSAELRPNQKDRDSLPPYSALDPILEMLIEEERGVEFCLEKAKERSLPITEEEIRSIAHRLWINEFKKAAVGSHPPYE